MFKKHPGKKTAESAEAQHNSVQTAGKTDETEGDFARLFLCRCYPYGNSGDEIVSQSLISIYFINLLPSFVWQILYKVL